MCVLNFHAVVFSLSQNAVEPKCQKQHEVKAVKARAEEVARRSEGQEIVKASVFDSFSVLLHALVCMGVRVRKLVWVWVWVRSCTCQKLHLKFLEWNHT